MLDQNPATAVPRNTRKNGSATETATWLTGYGSSQPAMSGGTVNTRTSAPSASSPSLGPARILRVQQVQDRTGLSRTTIWRLEQRNQFPKHCRISARAIGWREADVTRWIEERPDAVA